MEKKGSVLIYGIMLGLVIIILALALAPTVSQFTTTAMNESSDNQIGLNCSSDTISNFDKAACVVVDLNLFYFIAGLIFIAGAVITAKIVFS